MRNSLLLSLALAGSLAAQGNVFVVDRNNGLGTDFTSIRTAVAAVADGSILQVRPGSYQPFSVSGKGLRIFGLGAVRIVGAAFLLDTVIANLPVSRTFVLQNITFDQGSGTRLRIDNCAGNVLLDGIVMTFDSPLFRAANPLEIRNSQQVTLGRSTLVGVPAVAVARSGLAVHECQLRGRTATLPTSLFPGSGITLSNSDVFLVATSVAGGDASTSTFAPPAPALRMTDSILRAAGASTLSAGGAVPTPTSAVTGSGGRFEHDPAVLLIPHLNAPAVTGVPSTSAPIPSLIARGAPLGRTVATELTAAVSATFALFVSQPARRSPSQSSAATSGSTSVSRSSSAPARSTLAERSRSVSACRTILDCSVEPSRGRHWPAIR